MRNTILIFVLSTIIFGCSKSGSSSIPQIKFKSISTNVLQDSALLQVTLSLTTNAGDASNDTLIMIKTVPNCAASQLTDSTLVLPQFEATNGQSADIVVTYANIAFSTDSYHSIGVPQCNEDDTCYLKFYLKNSAGDYSDTVQTGNIIIKD
jgi:hypothetical protein